MLVDGNLLHQVLALDAHFLIGNEMLYDHISHVLTVGIAILVQAMYCAEDELIVCYGAVLTTYCLEMKQLEKTE